MITRKEFIQRVTQNIKSLRIKKELSQAKFAKKAGVARTTITNLEGGHFEPSLYTAYCIAQGHNTTIDKLVKECIIK